jgi:hypothetical protein
MAKYPTLVAIQPVMYPHPQHRMMIPGPHPGMILTPHQYAFAPQIQIQPQMIPYCAVHGATPSTSSLIVASSGHKSKGGGGGSSSLIMQGEDKRIIRRKGIASSNQNILQVVPTGRSMASNSVKSFDTRSRMSLSKAPSVISAKTESEKNNEVEITEVDVSRTYTGLDRDIAENYISVMGMYSRKESSVEDFDLSSERDHV